ncbi:NUDIX domain-containing protein [Actinoplanes sp. NPDC049118]|uniref:NUDIX domain-containing protein n=1 Tax=Actinoplanes sp. NPDC049118 TaxID=3155769 RepID=UPI0033D9A9F1
MTSRYRTIVVVHVLLRRADGQVLFLERAGTGVADGQLCLPGGHLEDEESVIAAVIWETAEEIGVVLNATDLEFVHVVHRRYGHDDPRLGFFFLATLWDGQPVNREPHKCAQLIWADPASPPANTIAYTAAALAQISRSRPFSLEGWGVDFHRQQPADVVHVPARDRERRSPMIPFAEGATVTRRDVLDGRVWTAAPHRVLSDDGTRLVLATWPGTIGYTPANWIRWFTDGDESARKQAVTDLAGGGGELGRWIWQDTIVVTWVGLDPDFNVQLYQPTDDRPAHWKINFERPVTRTAIGIDTCDLLLDLITDPASTTWRWKDEDEYDEIRRHGLVSDAEDRRVQAARLRAVAFVEAGQGPLAEDWSTWRVPDDWPLPQLSPGALDTGTR